MGVFVNRHVQPVNVCLLYIALSRRICRIEKIEIYVFALIDVLFLHHSHFACYKD